MTKTSKRTHPLDRDGDGQPGGSLPGNETAPMQFASEAVADPADPAASSEPVTTDDAGAQPDSIRGLRMTYAQVREMLEAGESADSILAHHPDLNRGDLLKAQGDAAAFAAWEQERLELMERETDEANAAARSGGDNDTSSEADGENTVAADGAETIDLAAATDALDQAFADSPNDDDQDDDGDASPTFDDEETEAPLNSEDDDEDDNALDASADRTQVAARIRDLTILVGARRLYKSDEGYSSNYGAPYVGHDTIAAFVQAGLAEDIPSAGNQGGVKLTAEARRMLADLKREAGA